MTRPMPGDTCAHCGSGRLKFDTTSQGSYLCIACKRTYIPKREEMTENTCPICSKPLELVSEHKSAYYVCESCGYSKLTKQDPMPSKQPPEHDPVNHPSHYTQGGIECIDALRACLTPEEFRGFCKGNSIKYLWRNNHKNSPSEDAAKAQWYLNKLNEVMKDE